MKGEQVGGSPTGPRHQPGPREKTKPIGDNLPAVAKVAAGSNKDHAGGKPKGSIHGGGKS